MQNTTQEFKVGDKFIVTKQSFRDQGYTEVYTVSEVGSHGMIQFRNHDGHEALVYTYEIEHYTPEPEKHIHHDLIVAWAKDPKGCVIQWRRPDSPFSEWMDCSENKPDWYDKLEYRIKPRTKIKKYKYSLSYTGNGILHTADHYSDEEWQQRLKENPTKFFTRLEWTEKEFEEV